MAADKPSESTESPKILLAEKLAEVAVDGRLEGLEAISRANTSLDAEVRKYQPNWFPNTWYCWDLLDRVATGTKREMTNTGSVMPAFEAGIKTMARLNSALLALKKQSASKETLKKILQGFDLAPREIDRLASNVQDDKIIESVASATGGADVDQMSAVTLYALFREESVQSISTPNERSYTKLYLKNCSPQRLLTILDSIQ